MITEIYRIKTLNSIYEVHVLDTGIARCRKTGLVIDMKTGFANEGPWQPVTSKNIKFLDKLIIGAGFFIPGVAEPTSDVQDYAHFTPTWGTKRRVTAGGLSDMINEIVAPVRAQKRAVVVAPEEIIKEVCGVDGCTYTLVQGGPNIHRSNKGCKSGGRPHCTCDYCF